MLGGILARYANMSIPPEHRARFFVEGEARLTFTRLLMEDLPDAEIYLVGGTLRDVMIGRMPNDIDLVVRNVEPEKLENWLNRHGAAEFVGRFGTYKFVPHGCQGKDSIDIALPRTERIGEGHAGGRSDMDVKFDAFLPIKEDLSRRDFTINAMAYSLSTGRLIDPFLGLHDLQAGVISAVLIPEQRFFEDATRMLRALRLASQLCFGIESHTWTAIVKNIPRLNNTTITEEGKNVFAVPREAIGKEFLLGFADHPVHTVRLWADCGALHLYMPALAELEDVAEQNGNRALEQTLTVLNLLMKPMFLETHGYKKPPATVLVAGLLSYLKGDAVDQAYQICRNLYFHQFDRNHNAYVNCEDVLWLLEHVNHFETHDPSGMRPSEFEDHFMNERGRQLLLLMHAYFVASGTHTVARERLHVAMRIADEFATMGEGRTRVPKLISGRDIQALNIPPGPVYRDLERMVRDAQLAHRVHTPDEAKELLRQLIRQL